MDLLDRLKPLLASSDLFYAAHTPRRVKPPRRLKPWERELVAAATPRGGHYAKMAGWVARQTRFPKARNEAIV